MTSLQVPRKRTCTAKRISRRWPGRPVGRRRTGRAGSAHEGSDVDAGFAPRAAALPRGTGHRLRAGMPGADGGPFFCAALLRAASFHAACFRAALSRSAVFRAGFFRAVRFRTVHFRFARFWVARFCVACRHAACCCAACHADSCADVPCVAPHRGECVRRRGSACGGCRYARTGIRARPVSLGAGRRRVRAAGPGVAVPLRCATRSLQCRGSSARLIAPGARRLPRPIAPGYPANQRWSHAIEVR